MHLLIEIFETFLLSLRPGLYSRRTNHLTSHTCTCGHAMRASAAGVSSACFQQEEWSGVGFGPVVLRVRNANLSPYLRSFPRQRIFQGSGKSNRKCLRLDQTSNLLFPSPGKSKRLRLPICFFPGRQKALDDEWPESIFHHVGSQSVSYLLSVKC